MDRQQAEPTFESAVVEKPIFAQGAAIRLPVCAECGAVVPETQQPRHRDWHRAVRSAHITGWQNPA